MLATTFLFLKASVCNSSEVCNGREVVMHFGGRPSVDVRATVTFSVTYMAVTWPFDPPPGSCTPLQVRYTPLQVGPLISAACTPLGAPPSSSQLLRFCQIQGRGGGCFKMTFILQQGHLLALRIAVPTLPFPL